ncbi:MAG: sensor histidine kinase, partial [Desulfofundulus sp.]
MKKISLTVKMWLALSLVSLLVYVVVILVMPFLIRNYFTVTMMEPNVPPKKSDGRGSPPPGPPPAPPVAGPQDFRIHDFIVLDDGT